MMLQADVVIEASRPRALAQLGLGPDEIFPMNPHLTWISITAHGRSGRSAERVGFGDDAAVAGGLFAKDGSGHPLFIGDAIADPIAGMFAAAGALASLLDGGGRGRRVDVSMRGAAAYVARAQPLRLRYPVRLHQCGTGWVARTGKEFFPIPRPGPRGVTGRAAVLGEHTQAVLAELA